MDTTATGIGRITDATNPALLIVTAAHHGERSGCLVGFHSQCSIVPVRYAVWISRLNHTFAIASRADHLGLHFLDESDHDLAAIFGGRTGDVDDKFAKVDWTDDEHAVPILTRCKSVIVSKRTSTVDDGGDHVCIVCDPITVESAAFRPLRLLDVDDVTPGHPATS